MPFSVVRDGGEETTQEILARNVSLEQAHAHIANEIQLAEQRNVTFQQQGPDLWVSQVDSIRLWVTESPEYTDLEPLGSEPEKPLDKAQTDNKGDERYKPDFGTNPENVESWSDPRKILEDNDEGRTA
jgi:hypothetical protein